MSIFHQLAQRIRGPRCHLGPEEKAWVDRRMIWLNEQFGSEPICRIPLDPASELLPKKWNRSRDAGADLFKRLCDFMRVDAGRLRLHFYSQSEFHEIESAYAGERHSSGPAGLYVARDDDRKLAVALDESALSRPAALAATICHELGHVHLLADQRIKRDEEDCEPLTDLLTIYFGAGILTANAAFQFSQWQDVSRQGWSASRQGYLSEALLGYSLACFSWYRGDLEASWCKHLRQNIAYYFHDSMHFLSMTRDSAIPFGGA
jgi:hypothetical protein